MIATGTWTGSARARRGAAAMGVALALSLLGSASAGADVTWLCHPSSTADPCEIPLDTTVGQPGGGERVERPARVAADRRPVDCFYVYPTVSNQPGPNATKARDPEILSIAKYQASRFSAQCRMFAPIYRQVTLAGIPALVLGSGPSNPAGIAYGDVLEAWRRYLADENDGRGVVLLGHSQGTLMLRRLIREEIDSRPEQRRLLVGGVLLGGNVSVARGRTSGGDFRTVPVCSKADEAGCVVAYSTYSTDPGPVAFFGRSESDIGALTFGFPSGSGYRVACTDPVVLGGTPDPVGVTVPSEPFAPGPIALGIVATIGGAPPTAPTTWAQPADRYTGACRDVGGAHVYRYDPVGAGSRRLNEFPPTWGTHIVDMNLGLDRLTAIVGRQARTWLDGELRVGAVRRDSRTGTARITVEAPGAGSVAILRSSRVAGASRVVAGPGAATLTVRARGTVARRTLARRGTLRVRMRVRYTAATGAVAERRRTITLRRARRG